jgi:hypothetical protein
MGCVHRILQENTAGLRVTATKLIFISQNKQQLHHTQTNSTTELHSVGHKTLMVPPHHSSGGFPKIFKVTKRFKMFKCDPSPQL